jgi:hypothetical protein
MKRHVTLFRSKTCIGSYFVTAIPIYILFIFQVRVDTSMSDTQCFWSTYIANPPYQLLFAFFYVHGAYLCYYALSFAYFLKIRFFTFCNTNTQYSECHWHLGGSECGIGMWGLIPYLENEQNIYGDGCDKVWRQIKTLDKSMCYNFTNFTIKIIMYYIILRFTLHCDEYREKNMFT